MTVNQIMFAAFQDELVKIAAGVAPSVLKDIARLRASKSMGAGVTGLKRFNTQLSPAVQKMRMGQATASPKPGFFASMFGS
jgi:hypothetical protein